MITKWKNITVSKLSDDAKKSDKSPSHNLVITDASYQNKQTAGKLWTKESTYGKFLSGKMSDTQTYNEKVYEGFCIVNEKELDDLISKLSAKQNSPLGNDYPVEGDDGVLNPADIPF